MLRALVVVSALLLAGCGEDGSSVAPFEEETVVLPLSGVVVDEAISPVAEVIVAIEGAGRSTTTDEDGRFAFEAVAPGTVTLTATRPGFVAGQTTATVVADMAPVRIGLVREVTDVPFVVAMQWDGFLGCSFYVATLFGTGCLLGDVLDDGSRDFAILDEPPEWLQSEMTWQNTQPAGENLCMRHYASSGIGGDTLGDACGASPQTFQSDEEQIQATGVGNTRGLERVVWVDHAAPDTVGLAVDQRFTVFTHHFHNVVPESDWRFLDDGPYPL